MSIKNYIRFTVDDAPKPLARHRSRAIRNKHTGKYYSQAYDDGRNKLRKAPVQAAFVTSRQRKLDKQHKANVLNTVKFYADKGTPVFIIVRARVPYPKHIPKKVNRLALFPARPDGDNILKLVLDSLDLKTAEDKAAYYNDSQFVEYHVYKQYSIVPGLDVVIGVTSMFDTMLSAKRMLGRFPV